MLIRSFTVTEDLLLVVCQTEVTGFINNYALRMPTLPAHLIPYVLLPNPLLSIRQSLTD
jgi:hypothetical protein